MADQDNGNTLKYRIEQLEEYRRSVAPLIDEAKILLAFVKEKKAEIQGLDIMRRDIELINEKLDAKHERDKWVLRLIIGTLTTGILTPIIIKLLGY